jgi:hypothetical protein
MWQKKPESVIYSEMWLTDTRLAHIQPQQTVIVDQEKNVVYIIYRESKTYVEASLPLDMKKLIPREMRVAMSMWKVEAKTTTTNKTRKIKEWNCRGYKVDITMGMMSMMIKTWATTDVPINWKNFSEKLYPLLLQLTVGQSMDEKTLNQYRRIEGLQVFSEITVNMMNQKIKSTKEIVEIAEKSAPPAIYSVPAGYKKQDKIQTRKWGT